MSAPYPVNASALEPTTEPLATTAALNCLLGESAEAIAPAQQQTFDRLSYIFRRAGTGTTTQSLFGAMHAMRAEPQEVD